jgi:tetratricopeptide (TPR) repeat protein
MKRAIKIAIIAVVISSSSCFAAPTEKDWRSTTNEALDHYYYGRKKEAVEVARKALKQAEELFGPDDLKTVGSVDDLATYLTATGSTKEADKLYQRALSILEKKLSPADRYLAIFMDYLALFYDKIGKNEYAKQLRGRAKAIRLSPKN